MAPIWKPLSWEILEAWLGAIQDEASDDLTDWETNFVNDMAIRIQNRWALTEAQEKKLESIYAEKTK